MPALFSCRLREAEADRSVCARFGSDILGRCPHFKEKVCHAPSDEPEPASSAAIGLAFFVTGRNTAARTAALATPPRGNLSVFVGSSRSHGAGRLFGMGGRYDC